MAHSRRAALVVALLVAFVAVGAAPVQAAGMSPDFYGWDEKDGTFTSPIVDTRIVTHTKWRPNRRVVVGSRAAWLGLNPYRADSGTYQGVTLRVRWEAYGARTGSDWIYWNLQARAICVDDVSGATTYVGTWPNALNGSSTVNSAHTALSTIVSSRRNEAQGEQQRRYIIAGSNACGSGKTIVGAEVRLAEYDNNGGGVEEFSPVYVYHVENPERRPNPPDDQWDLDACVEVYGPPPWHAGMVGVWQGFVTKIEDSPCLDLEDDWETDFSRVCANPPPFDFYEVLGLSVFPTVESLGEWIGHYANCLFVPRGGFETDTIGEAAEGGWMGDTRTILAAVAADFGGTGGMSASASWEQPGGPRGAEFPHVEVGGGVIFEDEDTARKWLGDDLLDSVANGPVVPLRGSNFAPMAAGCGEFVEALPVVGESISSCSLGSVWPDSFRTAAGALLMITAAFSALFAILRFMGVRYGWSTG